MSKTQTYSFNLPTRGAEIDGRYRVVEQIGEGSYGWVFAVEHQFLGQTFAMKILHPRVASDPSWVVRFREEAKSTSLIGHENIVFVTDFGKCRNYGYFFVMEHLEGASLDAVIAEEAPLGMQRSLRITLQAASALSSAHDLGIVHRDLKPGNIMLVERSDGSEASKLLDFGISSIVMVAAKSSQLYGTPAYMAPEQAVQPDVDHRADQFSLAAILYEMLTGQKPWLTTSWDDATPEARTTPPRPPSELREEVGEALDEVILRALSVRFEDRWSSIDEFSRGLVSACSVQWIPKSDPLDFWAEATEVDEVAPQVTVRTPSAGESLVIVLDDVGDVDFETRPQVTVRFRTADRLAREYRRNLLAGGLFLPSDEQPELHSEVDLCLVFEPSARSLEVRAQVVAHSSPAGERGGFGVAISADDRDRLTHFLRSLRLGLELSQADVVRPMREPTPDEDLSAAEAFLFSRIDEAMPVAKIRTFASGLPFDVEQAIQSLVERGCLEIEPADLSSLSEVSQIHEAEVWATELPTEARTPERVRTAGAAALVDDDTRLPWLDEQGENGGKRGSLAEPSEISYSRQEVGRVLAMVRYFKARQNYFGAIQVLRKALEVSPSVPEFYHQLALLHAQFRGDYPRAFQALHGAIQLDPQNDEYKRTRAYLEKLAGLDE
ncbi:hypothetical protein FIV42_14055 [Persicimonas caeni]|uniref:Protein kinase domain-containing protein n=1 Tax=Persicimonas caeni TaxID=2292766 RepID=A0A4Y6PU14_PERCE|nr:serine/threonine-protein kinase [Persicimonas caeni]QDG51824.1 hypothetical protein FIV42_14055 [Persicimonas caeni]QED33045.1 protein kinase [Persicimonas caeni]